MTYSTTKDLIISNELGGLRAYMIETRQTPPNNNNQVLNRLVFKLILKLFVAAVKNTAVKKLPHHNTGLALHSEFNATEKKKTIAR